MENKLLGLTGLGILGVVLLLNLASCLNLTLSDSPETLTSIRSTTDFTVSSNTLANFALSSTTLEIADPDNAKAVLTISPSSINNASSATFNINVTSVDPDFDLGRKSAILKVNAVNTINSSDNSSIEVTLNFEKTACSYEDNGNLDVEIDDIRAVNGFGDDEEWFLLDEIEMDIDVENNGEEEIRNIVVEWGLYNKQTGKWLIKDKEDDFDLDDGDKETVKINFQLDDPGDFEDSSDDDFVFYVWATGNDKEFDNNKTCRSVSRDDIRVITEDDFVVLYDINLPESSICGDSVRITAEVWNIGDSDQRDVYVQVSSSGLGIVNEKVDIGDIDAFEKENFEFVFDVPKNIEEGKYNIMFTVYDRRDEAYEYDNEESEFTVPLTIEGGCVFEPELEVTANLESGGVAGEELVIKVLVENTAAKSRTLNIGADDYQSWAELVEIIPNVLTLKAGEAKEVLVRLKVNSGVSGEKSFNIEMTDGNNIIPQPVSVPIKEENKFSFFTGNVISKDNWYLWGIGALNVLLVLIIIVVAIKLVRKK
jgi:hypothetical protein